MERSSTCSNPLPFYTSVRVTTSFKRCRNFYRPNFRFSSYAGRHSTPLYLGDEDHNFPVMLVGGLLVMASSNIDRAGGRKG